MELLQQNPTGAREAYIKAADILEVARREWPDMVSSATYVFWTVYI